MLAFSRMTVALGCLAVAFSAAAQDQVPWAANLEQAQQAAQEQRKLILLHFYNDHCPPCERVEREVFASPRAAQALARNYVPVKIHAGAQPKIAEQFRVDRWPTDIVCTPAGLEVMRTTSPQKPEAYVGLFDQVALQAGVGAATQWQTAMQAAGQQVMDSRVAQAQAITTQANTTAQAYADQAGAAVQGFTQQAQQQTTQATGQLNQATQQAQGALNQWTQRANNSTQQLGDKAQQMGSLIENTGRDLRTPWNNGAPPPAPGANPPTGSVYDQFAQQPAASPPAPQPSAPAAAPPPAAPRSPAPQTVPSLPTANPFIGQHPAPAPQPQAQGRGQGLVPASQAPPIALEGYCPVTLLEQVRWQRADARFGAIHRGRTYLFASEVEQKKFLANPDRYSPALSGLDPVIFSQRGEMIEGTRGYGWKYRGQVFLFSGKESLETFAKSPEIFAESARQATLQAQGAPTYR